MIIVKFENSHFLSTYKESVDHVVKLGNFIVQSNIQLLWNVFNLYLWNSVKHIQNLRIDNMEFDTHVSITLFTPMATGTVLICSKSYNHSINALIIIFMFSWFLLINPLIAFFNQIYLLIKTRIGLKVVYFILMGHGGAFSDKCTSIYCYF